MEVEHATLILGGLCKLFKFSEVFLDSVFPEFIMHEFPQLDCLLLKVFILLLDLGPELSILQGDLLDLPLTLLFDHM